jgi:hypothetical protein
MAHKSNASDDASNIGSLAEEMNKQFIKESESFSTDLADTEKQDAAVSQPPVVADWDGPDDPDNPHNWPLWLGVYHATMPGLFGFAVYVVPGYDQICLLTRLQHLRHISVHTSSDRHYERLQCIAYCSIDRYFRVHTWPRFRSHLVGPLEREVWEKDCVPSLVQVLAKLLPA